MQLADGYIERPIGLLEQVQVTSCGIEYEHTCAVVDFGKSPNYKIILGRPFMHQHKMIQDWGYDYIYLRQLGVTTRVNVKDHSYRDVAKNLVGDVDSITIAETELPSWMNAKYYRVPLVGKYGRIEGVPASDRLFGVSLIPRDCAKTTKIFRICGVADIYEQFDRPDNKDPDIEGRPRILEQALISSISLIMGDTAPGAPGEEVALLHYVRIPDGKNKGTLREQGGRERLRLSSSPWFSAPTFNRKGSNNNIEISI